MGSKLHIFYLEKKQSNSESLIDLNFYWIKIIGKYSLLFFKNSRKFFLDNLISFTPNYLRLRSEYYKSGPLYI